MGSWLLLDSIFQCHYGWDLRNLIYILYKLFLHCFSSSYIYSYFSYPFSIWFMITFLLRQILYFSSVSWLLSFSFCRDTVPSTASGSCSQQSWSLGSACIAGSANPWSWTWSSIGTVFLRSSPRTSETLTFVWSCYGLSLARSFLSLFANHLELLQQRSNLRPHGLPELPPQTQSPPPDSRPRWSLWKLRTFCWWPALWCEWCGVRRVRWGLSVVRFDNYCQLGQQPT